MDLYDALPYGTKPSRATHPDRAFAVARLHGVDPGDVGSARVLELGCGTGLNLLPMAAALPHAELVGVDTSAVQIGMGRAHVEALGLTNLTLDALDLREAPAGPFDLVVAHGLWSWVPPDVQEAVFDTVKRVLAPQGVAFVSWNALPGWRVRGTVRDLLRRHVAPDTPPRAQLHAARELLSLWVASEPSDPFAELVRQEAVRLAGKGDDTLFHDYLAPHNEPVYLDTFRARAKAGGLALLGEAELQTAPEGPLVDGCLDRALAGDVLTGRAFHRSLLCHEGQGNAFQPEALGELWLRGRVVAMGQDASGSFAFGRGGEPRLTTQNPQLASALAAMSGPGALRFGDLAAMVQGEGAELLRLMSACVLHGFVEPLARAPGAAMQLGPLPQAWAPARHLAEEGSPWVPSLHHEPIAVDGFDRALLVALDGACDQGTLVARLAAGGHGVATVPERLLAMVEAGLFVDGV